jgi:hypothetical protein
MKPKAPLWSFPNEGEGARTSKTPNAWMSLSHRHDRIVHPKNGDPFFLVVRQPRSDHVQPPCSWSADFSIGTGCAFDGTGSSSNDDFGFDIGGSSSCGRRGAQGSRERRATPGIQRRGLYVPAIKLAAINPQVWLVSTPENRTWMRANLGIEPSGPRAAS